MAVGLALTSQGGAEYNGKFTLFVCLSCMMAAMGGVIFGYDIGNSGGVSSMEPFLKKFFPEVYNKMKRDTNKSNYCMFDSQLLTSFTSSLYLAGLVASFFSSSVTTTYGRRPSILIGGASFLAGAAIGGAALNVYMIIIGRILLGVGVGFGNQAVPLYLSEMALPKYRGAINNGFQLSLSIGAFSASLINYGTEKIKGGYGWRISLALAAVPASILTLGAIFLPETPNSIIQQGKPHQKAKQMLKKIRGTEDVEAELQDLIKATSISIETHNPLKKIAQRRYIPQLIMAVAIPFFVQVTGINVVAFYAPELFRSIGLGESASLLSAVMTSVIGTSLTVVSMVVIDKIGRRFLLILGGVVMFFTQMTVGGIMAAKFSNHGELSKGYAYLVLILMGFYVAGYSCSWGPIGVLLPSEIFPLEIRGIGQSINVGLNFLFTFIVAQSFLSMLCHMRFGIFFFFGGWLVVMTVFVVFLLPETKGVPIEQMERVWREHWFWKRVVGEEGEDEEDTDGMFKIKAPLVE